MVYIYVIVGAFTVTLSQDPVYSQFYNSPLLLNPAFAGTSSAPAFSLTYRNQWPSLQNAYVTFSGSYDQFFDRTNSGLGLSILTDSAGDGILKTTRVAGYYSYKMRIKGHMQMKIGVEAAFVQTSLDWNRLIFFDQLDPRFGAMTPGGNEIPTREAQPSSFSNTFLDLGTGLLLYDPLYYIGISFKHLNNPDQSFLDTGTSDDGLNTRISIHGGIQINFDRGNKRDEGSFITPNVLYVRQAEFSQINIGAYTGLKRFYAGLWYRHAWGNTDALIFSTGVRVGNLKIGYSYDYTVSDLGSTSGGSHEIGMLLRFNESKRKKINYNDCLSIFR